VILAQNNECASSKALLKTECLSLTYISRLGPVAKLIHNNIPLSDPLQWYSVKIKDQQFIT
jgi:hypothetical protein